jgi:peptidyl-prolyl cis-trans isomerase SurA
LLPSLGEGIILESEVEAQAFAMKAQMAQTGQSMRELTEVQRCNLIEDLLFQKLLVHQARLDSIEVTPSEVMDEIERRLAYYIQMFGTVEAFEAEYGQSVSEWKAEFEDPVYEQLLAGRMQAEINQQVRATPAEVNQLFTSTPADSLPSFPRQSATANSSCNRPSPRAKKRTSETSWIPFARWFPRAK